MSIQVKKYRLLDTNFKEELDFTEFKARIKEAFRMVAGDRVKVLVRSDYYIVIGDITDQELRRVGKLINKHSEIGKFCKKTNAGSQLVKKVEYIELSEEEFENVYHFYEGAIIDGRKAKKH